MIRFLMIRCFNGNNVSNVQRLKTTKTQITELIKTGRVNFNKISHQVLTKIWNIEDMTKKFT